MNLQRLHSDVISKIRSSFTINTVSQCVIELVLNSLDAKPSAVAVRINFVTFRIQVVDNGEGITKENLALVGLRYMTNKCKSLEQLERHVKCYGFRGEALASVIDCSKSINITSKHSSSSETYSKSIGKHAANEVVRVKNRPSDGTTVTVEGLFYNLPVRKKRVIAELEMEDIKRNIEKLILMHPNISFTIRNDVTSELVLSNLKHKDIVSAFNYLHPEINDDFSVMKVSKSKVTIEALLFKESSEKRLQYIFVNKRPVRSSKIQKFVSNTFLTNLTTEKRKYLNAQGNKYPVFVINIKCPHYQVDMLLNSTKNNIQFENWNTVLRALEKLVYSFFDNESKLHNKVHRNLKFSEEHFKPDCGISQMCGAFKSYGYKRKTDERELLSNKKLAEDSEIIIESQISQKNDLQGRNGKNVIARQPHKSAIKTSKNEVGNDNEVEDDNDNYYISATTPHKEVKKRKFTKPLPIKLVTKKITRKPGIARSYSSMNISPNEELVNVEMEKNEIDEKNNVLLVQDEEKSVLSKFTNDENKGKTLIMDMFLKSTQVYNSEGNASECSNSQETIYEVESNFLMENNIQTNVNGFSKAMSMSVNVKSTKKIRKRKTSAGKVSRYIQTTLQNKEMVSKYIQTSLEEKRSKICRKSKNTNILSKSKIPENYTVVFSETLSTNKNPHFKFIHKNANVCDLGSTSNFLFNIDDKCQCTCQRNGGNIFNFAKVKPHSDNEINKNIELFNCGGDSTQFQITQDEYISEKLCKTNNEYFQNFDAKMDLGENKNGTGALKKGGEMIQNPRHKVYERSPYFLCKKNLQHLEDCVGMENQRDNNYPLENHFSHKFPNNPVQKNPYEYFNPVYQYNKNDEYLQNLRRPVYMPDPDNILYMHENTQQTKNVFSRNFQPETGSTVESFNKFQPEYCSTQFEFKLNDLKNVQEHTDLIFTPTREIDSNMCANSLPNLLNVAENHNDAIIFQINFSENKCIENDYNAENGFKSSKKEQVITLATTETWRNTDGPSKLLITLNDQQRQVFVEKEIEIEQKLLSKDHFQWDSQIHPKQNESKESDFATEWLKKYNNFGNRYYINRKSGFTTFYTPKPVTNQFIIGKRFDFMPKGMSQILKEVKEVDQSLNQSAKDKLVEYILETHQTDLLFVKWQNFIQDTDPQIFLENMYKEKLKVFENCIPNISTVGNKKTRLNNVISFTKELFQNIEIIGQVDKKFIAVLEKLETLLILFDQHAVHERIRLENIANTYKNKKAKCEEPLIYFIPQNDLSLLSQHESYISALGLSVDFFSNGVNVTEIPLYLYNKFKEDNCSNSMNRIVQLLIKEIIDLLKSTRGAVSSMNLPKVIQNIMNLEACRGAIKFGEALSKENCAELLENLSKCNLPFQCAHGRPTLAPILTLDFNKKYVCPKLNLKSLKCEGTM